ncbi:hypothetical protein ILUMI_05493 [Ignelater luminosus]|uniref:Uncharacterized protein n=1 Tax=Ignelater luminosus TaxID=2038154 RepID=A0A8K0GDI3_IGNLU|nr:hypothetical protein ILUMI_05493 [Ignelater luminosus]
MDEKPHIRICRTCLKEINSEEELLCIYQISHLLMSYASIKIIENDGLPSNICNNCHKRANQAYKFKILCEQSEQKLRDNINSFSKSNIDIPFIKEEAIVLEFKEENNAVLEICSGKSKIIENSFVKLTGHAVDKVATTNEFETICDVENENRNNQVCEEVKVNCKDKQYTCRFCDMCFTQQTRLVKHEQRHENGIKCYICEKAFLTFKQLRSHINIHNRRGAHLCQTCGKQFTMPENLIRHQRIHTGVRPYTCKLCNKSFTQSNELKSHMITHSSEKTHLCNVCGNKYARQMSLQVHMRRLHSDASIIRPYCCEICGRAFKDKRDLSQHTSIHKGERKHVCKVCGKAFNRGSNLKVHERIHFGPRPFVCHICQRSFVQKHVLNTHLKTHPNS